MPDPGPGVHGFFPVEWHWIGADRPVASLRVNRLLTKLVYQNSRASGAYVLVFAGQPQS
jgi:hypothetical protein